MSVSVGPAGPRPHEPASEAELVRRAAAGDTDAFEQLVERHRAVVVRVAARVVGRDEAEDVAQDALLRAFHRLHGFRHESPFRSWLLRITHNAALDALARRATLANDPVETALDALEDGGPRTPADRLEDSERNSRLAQKIRLLRPEHRVVLVLRDVEGLSYDEIAEVTAMPLGSVKGRLHRARRELIELLRRNTYDWELPDGER